MHVQNTYLFNNYLKFSSTYHLKNEKEKGKRWRKKFARSGRVVSWLRRAPISKLFAPSPYASHCWGWRKEGNGRADNPSLTDPSTLRKPRVATFLLSASPCSRHPPRWCLALPPSLRTKTLPNSIATLCSLGPETRAPLFAFNFRHPFSGERNLWGRGEMSRVSSSSITPPFYPAFIRPST